MGRVEKTCHVGMAYCNTFGLARRTRGVNDVGQVLRRSDGRQVLGALSCDLFKVAIDTDDRTIEIQYFDGAVEELDLEDWVEEEIALTEAPEDWTGSVDVEPEDYENEVENQPTETRLWADPLQYVDRGEIAGYSEIELPETPDELERY